MNLSCDLSLGRNYTSRSQQSRVISEAWCLSNVYCPACPAPQLQPTPANTRSIDFLCNKCEAGFQLKSQKHELGSKIVDSAYKAMIEAIDNGTVPHLFALRYDLHWKIRTLLVIPSFFFTTSAIEERRPLGPNARRAGWVGCNILLGHIPASGRIPLVLNGEVQSKAKVRSDFNALRDLKEIRPEARGWTLDVLRVVEGLGKKHFTLNEVYAFENELSSLHPNNKNVRPKIRQQLQVLRDLNKLEFIGPGNYQVH
ncbi:MAG TPA: DpnI domain-containing protein [Terriglobales bacterium]|nr:DpnI domain-containing protein [Terriglobales bacterium]